MAKLNKVNKNNSLSVILPKSITENFWKEGDDVSIQPIGHDAILIDRQECDKIDINQVFNNLIQGIESYKNLQNTLKDATNNCNLMFDEEMFRKTLKQYLLEQIRRL